MWLRWAEGQNHPGPEELAPLGFDPDRVNGHGTISQEVNPVLDRHIEPQHIGLSLPEIPKPIDDPREYEKRPVNQSLLKIDRELAEMFRGPVMGWGIRCKGDTCGTASLDLGPMDFRHAVDEMRMGRSDSDRWHEMMEMMACPARKIIGVRVNCEGDKEFRYRFGYEDFIEHASFLSQESEIPTPVADRIGLPLIVRKLAPGLAWRDRNLQNRMINYHVSMLNPPHQPSNTGSLIVTRKDGKPLLPAHLLALTMYTGQRLRDPAHPEGACITPDMMKLDRLNHVSKDDFEQWYNTEWMAYPISDKSAPSPFTIPDDFRSPLRAAILDD
jgi:hypothetical protein